MRNQHDITPSPPVCEHCRAGLVQYALTDPRDEHPPSVPGVLVQPFHVQAEARRVHVEDRRHERLPSTTTGRQAGRQPRLSARPIDEWGSGHEWMRQAGTHLYPRGCFIGVEEGRHHHQRAGVEGHLRETAQGLA